MAFRAAKLLEPLPYGRAARRSARSMSGRADKRGQAKCRPACQASSSIDGELLSPPQAYTILTSAAAASCFPAAKLPMGASWTGARQKQLVLQRARRPGMRLRSGRRCGRRACILAPPLNCSLSSRTSPATAVLARTNCRSWAAPDSPPAGCRCSASCWGRGAAAQWTAREGRGEATIHVDLRRTRLI